MTEEDKEPELPPREKTPEQLLREVAARPAKSEAERQRRYRERSEQIRKETGDE